MKDNNILWVYGQNADRDLGTQSLFVYPAAEKGGEWEGRYLIDPSSYLPKVKGVNMYAKWRSEEGWWLSVIRYSDLGRGAMVAVSLCIGKNAPGLGEDVKAKLDSLGDFFFESANWQEEKAKAFFSKFKIELKEMVAPAPSNLAKYAYRRYAADKELNDYFHALNQRGEEDYGMVFFVERKNLLDSEMGFGVEDIGSKIPFCRLVKIVCPNDVDCSKKEAYEGEDVDVCYSKSGGWDVIHKTIRIEPDAAGVFNVPSVEKQKLHFMKKISLSISANVSVQYKIGQDSYKPLPYGGQVEIYDTQVGNKLCVKAEGYECDPQTITNDKTSYGFSLTPQTLKTEVGSSEYKLLKQGGEVSGLYRIEGTRIIEMYATSPKRNGHGKAQKPEDERHNGDGGNEDGSWFRRKICLLICAVFALIALLSVVGLFWFLYRDSQPEGKSNNVTTTEQSSGTTRSSGSNVEVSVSEPVGTVAPASETAADNEQSKEMKDMEYLNSNTTWRKDKLQSQKGEALWASLKSGSIIDPSEALLGKSSRNQTWEAIISAVKDKSKKKAVLEQLMKLANGEEVDLRMVQLEEDKPQGEDGKTQEKKGVKAPSSSVDVSTLLNRKTWSKGDFSSGKLTEFWNALKTGEANRIIRASNEAFEGNISNPEWNDILDALNDPSAESGVSSQLKTEASSGTVNLEGLIQRAKNE